VDISAPPGGNDAESTLQILPQTFAIMGKTIHQYERRADVEVRPPSQCLKPADFSARWRAMDSGWAAVMAALLSLRVCLEAKALAA
jgi:NTE family protein